MPTHARDIARDVSSSAEREFIVSKKEDWDRRLGRHPLDIAENEAVEHGVAEHDNVHTRKGGDDFML
jgi:hypothetical protein